MWYRYYMYTQFKKINEYYKKIECDKISLEIVDEILGDKKISSKINSMDNVSPISPSKVLKKLSKSKDTRKIKVSKSKSNSHDYYLGKNGKNKSKNSPTRYGINAIATFSKRTSAIVAAVK